MNHKNILLTALLLISATSQAFPTGPFQGSRRTTRQNMAQKLGAVSFYAGGTVCAGVATIGSLFLIARNFSSCKKEFTAKRSWEAMIKNGGAQMAIDTTLELVSISMAIYFAELTMYYAQKTQGAIKN